MDFVIEANRSASLWSSRMLKKRRGDGHGKRFVRIESLLGHHSPLQTTISAIMGPKRSILDKALGFTNKPHPFLVIEGLLLRGFG